MRDHGRPTLKPERQSNGKPSASDFASRCSGIEVTDVWDSKDAFEQFAAEQIGPITADVGIPGPPQITFHEVHNYLTAG